MFLSSCPLKFLEVVSPSELEFAFETEGIITHPDSQVKPVSL